MKLIIDISDSLYDAIKYDKYGLYRKFNYLGKLYDIIRDGTPLDKIRAEIKQRSYGIANDSVIQGMVYEREDILKIIDKYNVESEAME